MTIKKRLFISNILMLIIACLRALCCCSFPLLFRAMNMS